MYVKDDAEILVIYGFYYYNNYHSVPGVKYPGRKKRVNSDVNNA